jgi:hypothetical protein
MTNPRIYVFNKKGMLLYEFEDFKSLWRAWTYAGRIDFEYAELTTKEINRYISQFKSRGLTINYDNYERSRV